MNAKKPKIKAVIFDLGGVVMSGGYLPFIHHYCMECLTPLGKQKIAELEHKVNLGHITEKEFYKKIQAIFHLDLTPKQMHKLIVDKMQPNDELLEFIPQLKKAKVALFTNSIGHMAMNVLRERKVPVKKLFNKTFISSNIHLAKPDKNAYAYVLRKLRVKPGEALMVDDRKQNIAAVERLGMKGLVFKSAKKFEKDIKKFELSA